MDLLSSKTEQNRAEHHTDLYHGDELIIRRGQTFQIEVEFNRPFDRDTDKLHLDMKTGTHSAVVHVIHLDLEGIHWGLTMSLSKELMLKKKNCAVD